MSAPTLPLLRGSSFLSRHSTVLTPSLRCLPLAAAFGLLLLPVVAQAQTSSNWQGISGALWGNASSWDNNIVPNSTAASAVFPGLSGTNTTIDLNGLSFTLNHLTVQGPFDPLSSYILSNGTLTFTGGTTVNAGTLQLGNGTALATLIGGNGADEISPGVGGNGLTAVTVNNGATFHVLGQATVNGGNGGVGINGDYLYDGGTGGDGGAGVIFSTGGTLSNNGSITGGIGGGGSNGNYLLDGGTGGNGGAGVIFSSGGTLTNSNSGFITGGSGGIGGSGGSGYGNYINGGIGGDGGAGVIFSSGGTLTNDGSITGGIGGSGGSGGSSSDGYIYYSTGGDGGAGVIFSSGGTLTNNNSGSITGGSGANGANGGIDISNGTGGAGGAGVIFSSGGTLTNNGSITGGIGGIGGIGASALIGGSNIDNNTGGDGGAGVIFSSGGTLTNNGSITGGIGGIGGVGNGIRDGTGGAGGTGVIFSSLETLTNNGSITGGSGGSGDSGDFIRDGSTGGAGGAGVIFSIGGTLTNNNSGSITGGIGGIGGGNFIYDGSTGGAGGVGVIFSSGGTLTNNGSITGGNGGNGDNGDNDGAGDNVTGGDGGAGVIFSTGGTLTNAGTINGGAGGSGTSGNGAMGVGVFFGSTAAGTLINQTGGKIYNGVVMENNTHAVTLYNGSVIDGGLNMSANTGTTLTLNGVDTQLYSAAVVNGTTTFNGALIKEGSGTWILDQSWTHSGGTTVDEGTLTLIGENTYTGGTTISIGSTLQIGDGGILTSGSITGDVANAGTLIFNRLDPVTFAGNISGAGKLTQAGTGTLTLTGANTYSGGTTISAGTLQIGDGGTSGSITGDVANAGTLIFNRLDPVTFAGNISGAGSLTKTGAGTLTLTGANTYSGGTAINGGTLLISNYGQLGDDSGALSFANGGILLTTSSFTMNRATTLNAGGGTFSADSGTTLTMQGVVSGAGSLTKTGAGTLTLTGANTYSGGTAINGGTLVISSDSGLGDIVGALSFANGGILLTTSSFTMSRATTLNAGGGTFSADPGTILTMQGVVSGVGKLTKEGTGTLTLTGANTYAGGTTISEGTLQIGNGGTSGIISGNVVNNSALVFNRSNTVTFAGIISGTGTLTKEGPGQLTLTGANTYTGGTTVNSGILQVDNDGGSSLGVLGGGATMISGGLLTFRHIARAGNGSFTNNGASGSGVVGGGTTFYENSTAEDSTITNYGASLSGSLGGFTTFYGNSTAGDSTITNYGASVSGVEGGYTSFYGNSTAGDSTITNYGASVSGGTYFWGSSTADGATLIANGATLGGSGGTIGFWGNSTGGTATVEVYGNGNLDIGGHNFGSVTIGSLAGDGDVFLGDNMLIVGSNNESTTFAGAIQADGGFTSGTTGSLTKIGTGTLTLTGANTYSGGTTINSGRMVTTHASALGSGPVTLNAGGILAPTGVLHIDSLTWNGGEIALNPLDGDLLEITGAFTNGGNGGTFILGALNLGVNTLATFGSTDFTVPVFISANPDVNYGMYAFFVNGTSLQLNAVSATATGSLLQNDGPVYIPTFADFTVNGPVRTGSIFRNNIVKSLTFNPGSSLQVFNNLIVTSGNFTVNGGRAVINGGHTIVPGDFNKNGGGTLVLNTFLQAGGNANINQGALYVNGSLTADRINVFHGALLGGSGVIFGDVFNSGTVAPGNSPGTLTIIGNYTQTSIGTLQIEIASEKVFDRLVVSGTARLDGTLDIRNYHGNTLSYGQQVPFLQAGKIVGAFDEILMPEDDLYRGRFLNAGHTGILLVAPTSYTLVAETPNQTRVAQALDRWIGIEDGDIGGVTLALDLLTAEQYPAAFEAIMPGYYEAALSTGIELSQNQGQMLFQQLSSRRLGARTPQPAPTAPVSAKGAKNVAQVQPQVAIADSPQWNGWMQGSGLFSDGGLSLTPGEDFDSGTFMVGADFAVSEHVSLGLFASYQEGWGDYNNGGNIDLESVRFGGYATYDFGGFYASGAVGGGTTDYSVKRPIQWATLDRSARSDPDGTEFFTLLGTGYDFHAGNLTFGPSLSAQYTKLKLDEFTESGADTLDLRVRDAEEESLRTYLGGRIAYTIKVNDRFTVIPELRGFWEHEFLQGGENMSASLNGGSGPEFGFVTEEPGKDAMYVGAGLNFEIGANFTTSVYYHANFGRNDDAQHTVSVSANWKF